MEHRPARHACDGRREGSAQRPARHSGIAARRDPRPYHVGRSRYPVVMPDSGTYMQMQTDSRLTLTPQFIIGVCLILFGILLTLDRMGIADAGVTLRYWPVALIAIGGWIVAERGLTGRSFPGYVMISIGSLMLLNSFGVVRVRVWELFWPLVIVLLGTRLIMQTPGRRREPHHWRSAHESQPGSVPSS